MNNANANTVREMMTTAAGSNYSSNIAQDISYNQVVVAAPLYLPDGTASAGVNVNGTDGLAEFNNMINWWVDNYATLAPLQKHLIINIMNEWGPANSLTWATAYESAIATLRAVGYTCPLMIDTGNYGQDLGDLQNYATAVFNSDPQKNIIFSLHMYYNAAGVLANNGLKQLVTLGQSAGMVFAVMEFGPGNGAGDTTVTPSQIIDAAEAAGLGWAAWAWDEGDQYCLTVTPGIYTGQTSQLTAYGQIVVPYLQSLAARATDF